MRGHRGLGLRLNGGRVVKKKLPARQVAHAYDAQVDRQSVALCAVGDEGNELALVRYERDWDLPPLPALDDFVLDIATLGDGRWLVAGRRGAYIVAASASWHPRKVANWTDTATGCSAWTDGGLQLTRLVGQGNVWTMHFSLEWSETFSID